MELEPISTGSSSSRNFILTERNQRFHQPPWLCYVHSTRRHIGTMAVHAWSGHSSRRSGGSPRSTMRCDPPGKAGLHFSTVEFNPSVLRHNITMVILHTYIHTYIHYITLHYITLHYITLHYITLHYITLHYITLHYITLHYITLHYITLHYITITLHYITLHYITLHYITLHYITLHYITLHTYIHTYICIVYIYVYIYIYIYIYIYTVHPLAGTAPPKHAFSIWIDLKEKIEVEPMDCFSASFSFCRQVPGPK